MEQTNEPAGTLAPPKPDEYGFLVSGISDLLKRARSVAARSVNAVLTAAYWEVGRRIVEHEQGGRSRAGYGEELLARLSGDLTARCGRGFSERNLRQMRIFYLGWEIRQTPSATLEAGVVVPSASGEIGKEIRQTVSAESVGPLLPASPPGPKGSLLTSAFSLSWSQYVRLMAVENPRARAFYESEAIRGGWSVRQLDRQISTRFYERAVRSRRPRAFLSSGQAALREDSVTVEEEVRDPYLLEFLNLTDEYSENDLEDALISHLQAFLQEMGNDFAFIGRQKRIRIGNSWYRIDLLLFHRALRCLVVIDLKTGAFTHADAGQMNLYLNYAKEHLMVPGEADPVGIILCSDKDDAVVHYATGGISTRVFAATYLTSLPSTETLRREVLTTQQALKARWKEEPTKG